MNITKDQLRAALLEWESAARAGETRSADESRRLPTEQVVQESTNHLWTLLSAQTKEPT